MAEPRYVGESWQSQNVRRDLRAAQERREAEQLQADAQRQRAARARAAGRRPSAPVLVAAEHVIRPEQFAPPEPPRQRRWRYVHPNEFYMVPEEETHEHDHH